MLRRRAGDEARDEAREAARLADSFAAGSRRHVSELFRRIRSNHDVADYRIAQDIMAGSFEWMERDIVGLQKAALEAWRGTAPDLPSDHGPDASPSERFTEPGSVVRPDSAKAEVV